MTAALSEHESMSAGGACVVAEPAVRLDEVTVAYPGPVRALQAVSLEIAAGSHVALLGASGSGKTTLLGCLSGRVIPTLGAITCRGRVATIHQDLRLVKQRTAMQNVLHGALGRLPPHRTLMGFPAAERMRAEGLLRRVGLAHRLHTRVGRLSGGEQQRVAIARALMQDPVILLADEPVANLDAGNAHAIMALLDDLRRERGLTLISVLHDCGLAERFADRLVALTAGKIAADEAPGNGILSRAAPRQHESEACAGLNGNSAHAGHEPCHACQVISTTIIDDPVRLSRPTPAPPRLGWRGWALVAILIAVYALAAAGLNVTSRDFEDLLPNLARFVGDLVPDDWQTIQRLPWGQLGAALLETLRMTLIGTTIAVAISWPLAALAARNVGPRGCRTLSRLLLNIIRSVPSLIWALLIVAAIGLGPVAGIAALVAYSIGYLTKFFYEAFEGVDPVVPDALREIGASGLQRFWHAVWPGAQAAVLSSSIFMLEYNVRAASVLGIVGAGGIGYELKYYVDYRDFPAVGVILLILGAVVIVLDQVSSRLRARLLRA
jgi:phosphonate ABC transporter permease subunit PhnE